ncbi:hypothetical protein K2P96_00455 [Patescibacteria group bacterium]|nr:hypothetical protein [Patescibacteria group bacterium]
MLKKKLLVRIVLLMFAMFLADRLAHNFFWYYTVWWFDMLMHFLGGLWVGLFFSYVFFGTIDTKRFIFKVIAYLFVVGVLWEIFEFATNNVIGHDPFNILDTVSDLFFDLAGGFFALFYITKKYLVISEIRVQLN